MQTLFFWLINTYLTFGRQLFIGFTTRHKTQEKGKGKAVWQIKNKEWGGEKSRLTNIVAPAGVPTDRKLKAVYQTRRVGKNPSGRVVQAFISSEKVSWTSLPRPPLSASQSRVSAFCFVG